MGSVPVPDRDEVLYLATGLWERPSPGHANDNRPDSDETRVHFDPDTSAAAAQTPFRPWKVVPDVVIDNPKRRATPEKSGDIAPKNGKAANPALPCTPPRMLVRQKLRKNQIRSSPLRSRTFGNSWTPRRRRKNNRGTGRIDRPKHRVSGAQRGAAMRRSDSSRFVGVGSFVVALSLAASPNISRSDPGGVSRNAGGAISAKETRSAALVRRVFVLTDLILRNHIDPPTRQEMILQGFREAFGNQQAVVPAELSSHVSEVRAPRDLVNLLLEHWPEIGESPIVNTEPASRLEAAFIRGLLRPVPGNPQVVGTKEARVQAQIVANRYVGIGIEVGADRDTKRPMVQTVYPGGPADLAGIRQGDILAAVNNDELPWVLDGTIEKTRGPEGSELTLRVHRNSSPVELTFKLVRSAIMIQSVHEIAVQPAKGEIQSRVACLKFDAITASTAQELRTWDRKLRAAGKQAIVLDMRGTGYYRPGEGFCHSAVLMSDSLLDGSPIGSLVSRGNSVLQRRSRLFVP